MSDDDGLRGNCWCEAYMMPPGYPHRPTCKVAPGETKDHRFTFADIGEMLDQIQCSCGWESKTYFDGREYAYAEWRRHVTAAEPATTVHLGRDGASQ